VACGDALAGALFDAEGTQPEGRKASKMPPKNKNRFQLILMERRNQPARCETAKDP
jgi:hypothetical protein